MDSLDRVRGIAWQGVLARAAVAVAEGAGDDLVVLPVEPTEDYQRALYAASQHDDDVTALAAIDVLRVLVALHETDPEED